MVSENNSDWKKEKKSSAYSSPVPIVAVNRLKTGTKERGKGCEGTSSNYLQHNSQLCSSTPWQVVCSPFAFFIACVSTYLTLVTELAENSVRRHNGANLDRWRATDKRTDRKAERDGEVWVRFQIAPGNSGEKGGHGGRRRIAIERHDDGQSQQLKKAEIGRRQDERRT